MTIHSEKMLKLIDEGAKEAEVALEDLKAKWAREDEQIAADRAALLAAHEKGAYDREEMRSHYEARVNDPDDEIIAFDPVTGQPVMAPPQRMSSLPVTPLAALGQPTAISNAQTVASGGQNSLNEGRLQT